MKSTAKSKKPEVVHKRKPIAHKLSAETADHLNNIVHGGLMRKVTPPHMETYFLSSGYARRAVGGLMPTEAGYKALMAWEARQKK